MHTYTEFIPVDFTPNDFIPFKMEQYLLINRINFLHFTESSLFLYLKDSRTGKYYFIESSVELNENRKITCKYKQGVPYDLNRIHPVGIILEYDNKMILVPIWIEALDKGCAYIKMQDDVYALGKRSTKRYQCEDVSVSLKNKDFHAQGYLINFSAQGLCTKLLPESSSRLDSINLGIPVQAVFKRKDLSIFKGICSIEKIYRTDEITSIVLKNSLTSYNSLKKRTYRNPRQKLYPAPKFIFTHPFLNKQLRFEIFDVSTSGFSILEHNEDGIIITGMIIQEASFLFPGELKLKFSAQVVNSQKHSNSLKKHGFVFLDMDNRTYDELFSILGNAHNKNVHTMSSVNLESLWEFFFNSNFIYEKKYRHIMPHIENLKKLYILLYTKGSGIFRSITYERNEKIYGHVSMIKSYPGAWMVHHLAAITMDGEHIGKEVLHQIINYLEGPFRMPSSDMNYLMFYYRPENTFPEFFFTNTYNAINNSKGCSIDLFDYLSYHVTQIYTDLPDNWQLLDSTPDDLVQLRLSYDTNSEGLLLDAFGLDKLHINSESIEKEYFKYGLERKYNAFSLKKSDSLYAVFIVDKSDIGINLSELLNSIKILITTNESFEWYIISIALNMLGKICYSSKHLTVLVHPSNHPCMNNVPVEKKYRLFIVSKKYGISFLENVKELGKMTEVDF